MKKLSVEEQAEFMGEVYRAGLNIFSDQRRNPTRPEMERYVEFLHPLIIKWEGKGFDREYLRGEFKTTVDAITKIEGERQKPQAKQKRPVAN